MPTVSTGAPRGPRRSSTVPLWILALACARAALGAPAPPALIDLPHGYYYREMYLPQLTSGPSSVTWSPDSREVIYSMAGSLWRQAIESQSAQQLTDSAGYDYQPDWSPDGHFVVYTSGAAASLELWMLDLKSGQTHQLTHDGAVALEPRWSPDGTHIAYVSTTYHRHFHLFVAEIRDGELVQAVRISGENKSDLPRYYYSQFDHEISPTWTRDGKSLVFVSNRGRIHGTGGLWQMPAVPGAPAHELRYEETNWRARPEVSPEGKRILYSSYLGRNWLQLWLMPAAGGEPFPLTYGEWDVSDARWSPDGRRIAAISNRAGNTQLRLIEMPGGGSRELASPQRVPVRATGTVHLVVRDAQGQVTPVRVVVSDARGRAYAPRDAWMHHAEFDRDELPFEARYFHCSGEALIEVPAGVVRIEIMKGLSVKPLRLAVTVPAAGTAEAGATIATRSWEDGPDRRWVSGDVHVHMNYGGHYRNTPAHLLLQAQAEDLGVVENLIVNKEQRIPDIAYSGMGVDAVSTANNLIVHGQEFHTSYWGHLGLLAIEGGILLPGYAGYPNTAAASLYPTNAAVADLAHANRAVVGYVHPFEEDPEPLTRPRHTDADELPVDVALGKVDYMEVLGFSDHQATAAVWYRLLNLGFRIPAAGGTDAMADYATLRGPVGLNRVYVAVAPGALDSHAWLEGLRAGRSFATNGPLLDFRLEGHHVGDTLELGAPRPLHYEVRLASIVPLERAEIVCNGKVVRELPLTGARDAVSARGELSLDSSGWCLVRAFTTHAVYPVLDNFVYATTSPVYVTLSGRPLRAPQEARYFVAWIDHLMAATAAYPDWNTDAERAQTLHTLEQARAVYAALE